VLKERRILDVRSHAHCCCAAAAFPPSPPDFHGVVQLADWAPQLALTSAGPGASAGGGGGLRIAGLIANNLSLKARWPPVGSRCVQGTLPADRDGGGRVRRTRHPKAGPGPLPVAGRQGGRSQGPPRRDMGPT
jgi:hypothetical protein